MEIRLQKYLAEAGIASRRASEKLIEDGRVKVNGQTVTTQGLKIDPSIDSVEYDGIIVDHVTELKYYMLHKPTRYVTTASDEKGRKTVLDLLPTNERLYPMGRLDYMSSGLLLITNDGDLTYKLTHPKHVVGKKYIAIVEPKADENEIDKLRNGADLGIYQTSPCSITIITEDSNTQTLEIILHEGKNRQIRRMFEWIDTKVIFLKRIAVGDLELGDLEQGEYRALTNDEIDYLKRL
ncbi:MAG: rRNA pseudouridine synthase [Firmicutes bacterium HGW-Firmicutes-1]|jgi:pseudouridine synthase|nr:MAG: rRNA pseudouridine synthase [Firmicutes bacterium HGW-Firmicutes-1]